jgi:hypothetical protein
MISRTSYCPRCDPRPARVRAKRGTRWQQQQFRAAVLRRAGGRCERCGSTDRVEAHHLVAVANGGQHHPRRAASRCAGNAIADDVAVRGRVARRTGVRAAAYAHLVTWVELGEQLLAMMGKPVMVQVAGGDEGGSVLAAFGTFAAGLFDDFGGTDTIAIPVQGTGGTLSGSLSLQKPHYEGALVTDEGELVILHGGVVIRIELTPVS